MTRREVLLVVIAAAASFLFIHHEAVYFRPGYVFARAPLESYILATIVIYLFLRLVIIAMEMRLPRRHAALVRCSECGQWLDDPTDEGREAHHRIELTPKPTKEEIVSAVALRKAVDEARRTAIGSRAFHVDDIRLPADLEGLSSHDLLEALNDPDLLERLRHSPPAPPDERLKR